MNRRVLVVDDQADIRAIVRMSLETIAGWTVLTASSGAEAVDLATAEPLDCVLLDLRMPGTDVPATIARLRELPHTARVPVVLMTAMDTRGVGRTAARPPEVDAVVAKPFDPLTLAETIRSVLGWEIPP